MISPVRWVWLLPLFSAVVWLAMLLALLLHWILSGSPHLPSMHDNQRIAYISNVGADTFKPLFIAMGTVSVISFDLGLLAERWMRHAGHLLRNTSTAQKVLSGVSIAFSIIGAAGLILLTIFDTWRHNQLHNAFLAVFM
jgi:Frag1/DRAM/Sfk1 family